MNTWQHTYLHTLINHPLFTRVRDVPPLWLAKEPAGAAGAPADSDAPRPARLTIQLAAEIYPRLVLVGPAGAGKTTLLRQLALQLAEKSLASAEASSVALPLYIELARFEHSIQDALAATFAIDAPSLEDLVQHQPLLFLLDGLDELAPRLQLPGLSRLFHTLSDLGPQARWICTCRVEHLPLVRHWIAASEVRSIRPLATTSVATAVRQHYGDSFSAWFERAADLAGLATRPRWLAALVHDDTQQSIGSLTGRGLVLRAWLPQLARAALAAHQRQATPESLLQALPVLVASFDQAGAEALPAAACAAAIAAAGPQHATDPAVYALAVVGLLVDCGILVASEEQQRLAFAHPLLRAFGRALSLIDTDPAGWPRTVFTESNGDTVVLAYSLMSDRPALLRQALAHAAFRLVVRCLVDSQAPDDYEELLAQSAPLTPSLRLLLADAFASENVPAHAIAQLEQVQAEGYHEAGLFGRLGDLYWAQQQWSLARQAYQQALSREPHNLVYRQRFGAACNRLGETDQALEALEMFLEAQRGLAAEAAYELGCAYLRREQFEQARQAFHEALVAMPGTPAHRLGLARAMRGLGRFDDAEATLRALLDEQCDDADAAIELGELYATVGRLSDAADCFRQALVVRPEAGDVYYRLGLVRRALGDISGALAALRRATELLPSDALSHFELGCTYEAHGDRDSAIAFYRHATRLDPGHGLYARRLGLLLHEQGDLAAAERMLRAAIAAQPDQAAAHADLANLLVQRDQLTEAIEEYQRALELAPHDALITCALGNAYRRHGNPGRAAACLRKALELDPDHPEIHYALGVLAEDTAQWDVALSAYARAAELDHTPRYARAAGLLSLKRGDRPRARRYLSNALWVARRDADTLLAVGELHASNGAWWRAIRALRRAAAAGGAAHAQLGWALAQVGRYREASHAYARALEECPDDPLVLYRYSIALAQQGQFDAAYDAARYAARLAPADAPSQQHAGRLALQLARRHEALDFLSRALALDPALVEALIDRGQLLLDLDRPQEALSDARAALARDRGSAPAALLVGQALVRLGRDSEAQPLLEQALMLDPTLLPAHVALRDLFDRAGNLASAVDVAWSVVALAPDDARHWLRLGELLLAVAETTPAAQQFEHALELDPSLAAAHAGLSQVAARAAAWEAAQRYAERAIALDPANAAYHVLLARAQAGKGDLAGAADGLQRAIEQVPDRAEWHHELGLIYQAAGDTAQALPLLRRAAALAPDRGEYHYAVAQVLRGADDPEGALAALEQAIRAQPDNYTWRAEMAEVQIARGWYDEALADLTALIEVRPHDAHLHRTRAAVHLHLGQPDAARADLVAALRSNPDDGQTYALLAEVLRAQGHAAYALEAAQRAVALVPEDPRLRYLLAGQLRVAGRRQEAVEQLEQALTSTGANQAGARDPALISARWAELARDYEAIDRIEEAEQAWRQAIALAPGVPDARLAYGRLLARRGAYAEAVQHVRQAIASCPDSAEAYAAFAELTITTADAAQREEAARYARRAVALQPRHSAYWRVLGAVLQAQGQGDEALQAFRQAHQLAPHDHQAAFLLGTLYLDQGAADAAMAAFKDAIAAAPDEPTCQAGFAIACRRIQVLPAEPECMRTADEAARPRLEQALAAIERALAAFPAHAGWWYERGLIEQLLADHAAAVESFTRCLATGSGQAPALPLSSQPTRDTVCCRRALSLYLLGQLEQARADQEVAAASRPGDAAAQYLLSRIARELGDLQAAYQAGQAAIAAGPAHGPAHLLLGQALLGLGRAEEALGVLEQAAKLNGDHAPTLAVLSEAYQAQGRYESALSSAQKALKLAPNAAEHHQRVASLHMATGRLNEARANLLNALALRPDVAAWHAQMGELCLRLGMIDTARTAYARAAELAPSETSYLYELARVLARQGRVAEARDTLERLLHLAPERGGWHYEFGRLQQQLQEGESALAHYIKAVQHDPHSADHWLALAELQHGRGERTFALETLERAVAHFGDLPELHQAIGALLEEEQCYDAAAWHYAIVVEKDPGRGDAWVRLGAARLEMGDRGGARLALERGLALAPESAEAHALLARVHLAEENDRGAVAACRRAVELAPESVEHRLLLAEALLRFQRHNEAYHLLAVLTTELPEQPALLAHYGDMALSVGLDQQALHALERAVRAEPHVPRYHYLLGKVYRRLRRYSRAIGHFRQAIKLQPGYSDAIVELGTLGPLAFVARHLSDSDDDQAVA